MGTCSFFARRKQSNFGKEVVAVRRESTFWAHQSRDVTSLRARRRPHAFGVSLVAMGADPHDLPSGFSVVSDSIRRDREALFGATRADVPTIADGDDSSDGSDVEVPVFFTTTGSDAETEAEGFGGPLPPGLLSPKPLDFKSRAGRSQHERLGEDVSERTDRDRDREAERRTPFSSATADDEAAALAAFELAAERALRVLRGALEQARARAPARGARRTNRRDRRRRKHLPLAFSFGRDVGPGGVLLFGRRHLRARPTALPAEAEGEMPSRRERRENTCARTRRDIATRGRRERKTTKTREDFCETRNAKTRRKTRTTPTRLASGCPAPPVVWRATRTRNERRSTATLVESSFVDDTEWERLESNRDVWKDAETAAETAFAARTLNASEPSEPERRDADPVLARDSAKTLDLGPALGGLDLDGLLRRLEAPGGEAVVASVTALRDRARRRTKCHWPSTSRRALPATTTTTAATRRERRAAAGASRRRDVEGWVLATAKARPQTARPAKADATGNARE